MATLPKKKKKKKEVSLFNKLTTKRFDIIWMVMFFSLIAWVGYVIIW